MPKVKISFTIEKNHIEFDNFKEAIEFSKELELLIAKGEVRINQEVRELFDGGVK